LWMMETNGQNNRMLLDPGRNPTIVRNRETGAKEVVGAHDPTISPDGRYVVFSRPNPKFTNFPGIPGLNTAHDLYIMGVDGTGLRRLTPEGPISIIPDWQGDRIVYTEISERDNYNGISVINSDGSGKKRLGSGSMPKWIPSVSAK
ncbi:MAG: TolB family protein, partial [Nitrososphaera sp.]